MNQETEDQAAEPEMEQDAANESPLCECNLDLTIQEMETGRCQHCGKALMAWVMA